ncbi:hypothetical protein SPRG_06774 [Saprolegnia parasitica CBS 223.65]|uniref:Uncharacterized protein n=1 Tax=Saprolegnia parasitica (strain CBS 223.65) TaxID=695850 RepID=A0A067CL20_SAPPC|nr:hypothetical protein SPRG_06774 [Saprolegnia parasitica CBS 223.65]KDO27507.1 hypothetical protein SPRG_06774 [Saprolegnia parasitica CBS 223.65]|eukprot:XP_012201634.1 hypothetical protein SPRG_06774 [Saprolegnia parasitica CBS 223.65]
MQAVSSDLVLLCVLLAINRFWIVFTLSLCFCQTATLMGICDGPTVDETLRRPTPKSPRSRSLKYYYEHRDDVLAKLRATYGDNKDRERMRQREKYFRRKARQEATAVAPLDLRLRVAFLLNEPQSK